MMKLKATWLAGVILCGVFSQTQGQAETLFSSAKAYDAPAGWTAYYSGSQEACIAEKRQGQGEKPFTDNLVWYVGWLADGRIIVGFHNPALPPLEKGAREELKLLSEDGVVVTEFVGFTAGGLPVRLSVTEASAGMAEVFQHEGRVIVARQPEGGGDLEKLAILDTRNMRAVMAALDGCKKDTH